MRESSLAIELDNISRDSAEHAARIIKSVNSPPPNRRWLRVSAGSRIDRPCGRLHHLKVIVWLRRFLLLDISLPHFIGHIAARRHPIPPRPQVLAPIPLPQPCIFAQQLVRTLPFQVLHRPRHRYVRRNSDQHVNMIPVDRSGIDHQFKAS